MYDKANDMYNERIYLREWS